MLHLFWWLLFKPKWNMQQSEFIFPSKVNFCGVGSCQCYFFYFFKLKVGCKKNGCKKNLVRKVVWEGAEGCFSLNICNSAGAIKSENSFCFSRILKDLLCELIRKSVAKSHPKLLLRRWVLSALSFFRHLLKWNRNQCTVFSSLELSLSQKRCSPIGWPSACTTFLRLVHTCRNYMCDFNGSKSCWLWTG